MSSRSLNKVMLIGNLTRDPELRYTPKGTAVCTFGLATNRYWISSTDGERQEETEFHRVVAWSKLAELCSQLLFKGRKAYVEGRLQTRKWTSSDGQERQTTEIVIDTMIVLDSKRRLGEEREEAGLASPSVPPSTAVKRADEFGDKSGGLKDKEKLGVGDKKEEKEKEEKAAKGSQKKEAEAIESKDKKKVAKNKEEVKAEDIPF